MKKRLQISMLAAAILLPVTSTIAGTIATDGNVPSGLYPSGTDVDPAVYIIGNTGPYVRDYGSTPLGVGRSDSGSAASHVHLYIQNGSTVYSGDESIVGFHYYHTDRLARLTDASSWTVNGTLNIGNSGSDNRLEILGGSAVTCGDLSISGGAYSSGRMTVSNANSKIIVTGDLYGGRGAVSSSSRIFLRENGLVRVDGDSAYVFRAYFGGGYFAWAGDHTDSTDPFYLKSLWNGSAWQSSADFDVRFTETYYATDAEAKAATADPDSGFEGYDGLGGYTIWESHLFEETPPESLLLNPGFADGLTSWTTDAGTPDTAFVEPAHDGYLAYFDGPASGQMHQDVDLLAEGYLAADINAGLYAVVFGGWKFSHEGVDVGQISVVFLNASQQELGTVSLPADAPTSWTESLQTNAIPAQTTTLRYVFAGTLGSGGDSRDTNSYLDDAYMDVIDMPPPDVVLTVESAHGTPVPMVGNHTNAYGSTIACSVSNGTEALTQYSSTGWTLTGNEPITGTANAFELTLTNNATLTWNWQTNYYLDVTAGTGGSIDVVDGFYAKDSEQILTAIPDFGWFFMGWSGDASGTNDEAFVFMTAPQSVTATFSDDADNDGLTNSEEDALGTNPRNADTDGDGFDDKTEVDYGLSPTADSSGLVDYIANNDESFGLYPSNAVLDVAVGEMLLETVGTEAVLSLQLEESDDLVTWTNAGEAVEWIWTVDGETKYFRVRSSNK